MFRLFLFITFYAHHLGTSFFMSLSHRKKKNINVKMEIQLTRSVRFPFSLPLKEFVLNKKQREAAAAAAAAGNGVGPCASISSSYRTW